jgi:hypothetical protein
MKACREYGEDFDLMDYSWLPYFGVDLLFFFFILAFGDF